MNYYDVCVFVHDFSDGAERLENLEPVFLENGVYDDSVPVFDEDIDDKTECPASPITVPKRTKTISTGNLKK